MRSKRRCARRARPSAESKKPATAAGARSPLFVPDLAPDPQRDDLPDVIAAHVGPLRIAGIDPDSGERFDAPVDLEHVAAGFADARRPIAGRAESGRRG